MNILEKYLTHNPVYKRNIELTLSNYINFHKNGPKGLMLHSVGCTQPNAEVFYKLWNDESFTSACVHAFIDANTGDVWQTLPWTFRAGHCASGPNGSGNNTHIGVEMCESNYIKYISGSKFNILDIEKARKHAITTYNSAVELFAYLCDKFNLNPLEKGVVISHAEGHELGIASDHGDPEHYWKGLGLDYTMDGFRKDVAKAMEKVEDTSKYTTIMGESVATKEQMITYIKKVNPKVAESVIKMIPYYISEGKKEGVRGDIAFAQSCIETGNFTFSGGTAVTLDQNNFCGMGVTSLGVKGNSFKTPQLGIRAQIQHLKAYASSEELVNKKIDPRFDYVERNNSPYVEWLGTAENPNGYGWAVGSGYGRKILEVLNKIIKTEVIVDTTKFVKNGQTHLNNYIGGTVKTNGVVGDDTKEAYRKAVQTALNMDFKSGLVVDGDIGTKSKTALKKAILKLNSKGHLVTVLQIGLMLNGIDVKVTNPGVFDTNTDVCVRKYQELKKLVVDGEVGINTWTSLLF